MKDKTKKRIKRALVACVVLGVIYGLAVGIGLIRLHNVYHDLRDDGRPMTLEEIIPAPVADQNNAALLYGSAIALLKAEPANNESLMEHLSTLFKSVQAEDPNEAAQQEIDQWLDSNLMKQVFALVEQGTLRSGCRFAVDYDDGFDIQMTHLRGLRTLTRLMARQAERLTAQAQYEQAWQLTETMARFVEATRDEPLLINQLVRIAQINVALETIQELCNASTPSNEYIAVLEDLFTSFSSKEALTKALDGERLVCDYSFFRSSDILGTLRLLDFDDEPTHWLFLAYTSLGKPLFLADHAYYLRCMNKVSRSFEKSYVSLTKEDLNVTEDSPSYFLMTRIVLPAFFRVYEQQTMLLARIRITSIGLEMMKSHQIHNAFPDTLNAWPQEAIQDPFTGTPLVYRKEANGFLLYSLGPNKEDDDGQVNAKNKREGDIAWQHTRPQ